MEEMMNGRNDEPETELEEVGATIQLDKIECLDTDDVLASSQQKTSKNSSKLISEYRCHPGDIGHTIEGGKPRIIILDADLRINSSESTKVLSNVLKRKCFEGSNSTVIICSDKSEAILACYALEIMKKEFCP